MARLSRQSIATGCLLWLVMAGSWAAEGAVGLKGQITGTDGEPLEGVLVLASPRNADWLVSVATDQRGRYAFPSDRMPPGDYEIDIRATGYRLSTTAGKPVEIGERGGVLDLELTSLRDPSALAGQLTSLEWLMSWPGDPDIKNAFTDNLVNCMFCHSLERIARSTHDSEAMLRVMQRMLTYETDHSSDERIQRVAPPAPLEGLSWFGTDARRLAGYLATVNLSAGRDTWDYPLETLPRPVGKATRALVTVFPIPRSNSVIHDLAVDARGRVWYGNTGWDYLGMLDPATGEFREWPAPNFLPQEPPSGTDRILGVQDVQVDPRGHVWAAIGGTRIARFLPETETWQVFEVPVIWRNPFLSPVRSGETGLWLTGLAAPPDGDRRHETAFRLDTVSGKLSRGINLFDHMPAPDDPFHADPLNYCYMMDQDADGNFLCTAPVPSGIIRGDLKSGTSRFYPTPTPHAYPRRGYRDDSNRFWFGEFYADKIGVMDLNTNAIREFDIGVPHISPYYARPDKDGFVWVSSTGSDRLLRLDPRTGNIVQYLMPVPYDARKVVVDTSASQTTVWLPNKNAAELIRVELLDD